MKTCKSKPLNPFGIFLLVLSLLLTAGCAGPQRHVSEDPGIKAPHVATCPQCPGRHSLPERIVLNLTENPSTSQAVAWRTWNRVHHPQAQIAPVTASSLPDGGVQTLQAGSERVGVGREGFVYHHSAVFRDLRPGTMYAYRVGADESWSEWNHFKTAEGGSRPFSFVYLGDPQEEVKSMCSRVFRAAYKKAPDADFWFFVGDLVDNGDRDEEWGELFYAFGWIPRTTPMILLPGNHEYPDKRYVKGASFRLFPLWRPHFSLPENGPRGLEETVYFVDYQGVRFVMLNGNERLEEQAAWLDGVLSKNPQAWTIAGIHQPVYSTAKYRDSSRLQELLVPIFDKYGVDLVLQGHDHTYCRTHKIRNGARVGENEKGTVYVISVSGPKFYGARTRHEDLMAKMDTGRQLFQVIHIDHDRLLYESLDVRGEIYDTFSLRKGR
ncbi:MAG: metallophosphoesterase [Desulfatiglandales bacterium]